MSDVARSTGSERPWFSAADTHQIALAPGSRIVSESEGLGWTDLYAVLTSERRWSGTLQPIDHLCFAYCLRRSATIRRHIQGEDGPTTSILRPRQIGILPTRAVSTWTLTGSADILMVYLRGTMVDRIAHALFGIAAEACPLRPVIGLLDPLLEQAALEIAAALNRRDPADPPYMDQLAGMAAAQLLRHHSGRQVPGRPRMVRTPPQPALGAGLYRVRGYIEDHLDRDLSLGQLAREASLSPALLTRAFAAAYHDTPHQYVMKRRVERTKHLLIGTDLPIAEVALQAGFSSQSHLSDVFKRVTGETPRSYRQGAGRDAAE